MPSPTARPTLRQALRGLSIMLTLCWAAAPAAAAPAALAAAESSPASYAPNEVVVGYASIRSRAARFSTSGEQESTSAQTRTVRLAPGESVESALRRLREQSGV